MNADNLGQAIAWLESGYFVQVTWALVYFLWQGCAIALVYAAISCGLRRTPANTRYVVGVAALLGMAACLPVTLWLLSREAPFSSVSTSVPPAAVIIQLAPSSLSHAVLPEIPAVDYAGVTLVKSSPYAVALYLAGVGLMLGRVAFGFWGAHRLRGICEPIADGATVEMFRRNARRMGLRVVPLLAFCQRISVPVVIGVLRPMILLPTSLASGLTLTQLEAVLLHELAHIRRFDLIVNVLQRLVEALLFFHPAVWWVSHRISFEREIACDDVVLYLNHGRVQYAEALLNVAELCAMRESDRAALAATGGNISQFQRRVLRLLGTDEKPRLRVTTFGVSMSVVMLSWLMLTPMVWRNAANAQVDSQTKSKADEDDTAAASSGRPAPAKAATKARQVMVVDVRIQGNKTLPVSKIQPYIRTRAGRPFDVELLTEDVRRLNHTHRFVNVKTYTQQVAGGRIVIFDLLERPLLQEVKFVGCKEIHMRTLRKEADIKAGDPVDPFAIEEARRKLEEFYHGKGFTGARITLLEGDKPEDRKAIFLINEGVKQKVWKTQFIGNTIASDERLNTQIKSKPLVLNSARGEVVRKLLNEDVQRLTAYYRGLGGFRVRVGTPKLEFNDKENWVTITYVIDEGPRYKLRNVSVLGNTKHTTAEIEEELELTGGKYFNQAKMTADLAKLKDKYASVGCTFTTVNAVPRLVEEGGQLDLTYNIMEGDR
jgi:Zn-dependent protease with chaperone function